MNFIYEHIWCNIHNLITHLCILFASWSKECWTLGTHSFWDPYFNYFTQHVMDACCKLNCPKSWYSHSSCTFDYTLSIMHVLNFTLVSFSHRPNLCMVLLTSFYKKLFIMFQDSYISMFVNRLFMFQVWKPMLWLLLLAPPTHVSSCSYI
jgi:hypothetical protein